MKHVFTVFKLFRISGLQLFEIFQISTAELTSLLFDLDKDDDDYNIIKHFLKRTITLHFTTINTRKCTMKEQAYKNLEISTNLKTHTNGNILLEKEVKSREKRVYGIYTINSPVIHIFLGSW